MICPASTNVQVTANDSARAIHAIRELSEVSLSVRIESGEPTLRLIDGSYPTSPGSLFSATVITVIFTEKLTP